jgi:hypothetical protein
VTLRTGAIVPKGEVEAFVRGLAPVVARLSPTVVTTDGVAFDRYCTDGVTKYFVGYRIAATPQLTELHRGLLSYRPYRKRDQTSFEPHLSLAYDDLSESGFEAIRTFVSRNDVVAPSLHWTCDNVTLYRLDSGRWVVHHIYHLVE